MPNNTKRRGDDRKAKRAAVKRAIELQYGMKLGPSSAPRRIGVTATLPGWLSPKARIGDGKGWKRKRNAARRSRC